MREGTGLPMPMGSTHYGDFEYLTGSCELATTVQLQEHESAGGTDRCGSSHCAGAESIAATTCALHQVKGGCGPLLNLLKQTLEAHAQVCNPVSLSQGQDFSCSFSDSLSFSSPQPACCYQISRLPDQLAHLLRPSGVPVRKFLEQFWQKAPLLVNRQLLCTLVGALLTGRVILVVRVSEQDSMS